MEAHTIPPVTEDPPPEAVSEAVAAARQAVDREFEIAERLDAKARGLVTIGAQWFGIAQAVSAVAFATKKPHDWMIWTVGGTALLGALALGALCYFCSRVWGVRDEPAVSPKGLLQMHGVAKADPDASQRLVEHYASILRDRRKTNKSRTKALAAAQILWYAAMVIPLVQLGFAVATRLVA